MRELTPRQKELLDFIIKYQNETNKIPSLTEMGKALGITKAAISVKIDSLTRKRYIQRENIYKILAATVPSAPIAKVEQQLQTGVGMERPLP